ncbi:unnamed protein product, partial [Choristocarpus tenellus]
YNLEGIVDHKRGVGRKTTRNYLYRLRFQGYSPANDVWRKPTEIPECPEMIAAYRDENKL